jgi:hypothetical protein
MFDLKTEIEINAKANEVWEMITDKTQNGDWNPLVRTMEGELELGNQLKIIVEVPNQKPMTFKPVLTVFEENEELRWVGKLPLGLFQGEHIFKIEETPNGVRLTHNERFSGLLLPLMKKGLDTNTRAGFELMNQKLKDILEK